MNFTPSLFLAFTILVLSSCSDEPVMSLPRLEDLAGEWECEELPRRTEAAIGKASVLGKLVLNRGGSYSVKNFPVADPMRLIDASGQWTLLDPTMTPSGVCSIELDGCFLALRRRGDRFVLRYPIDVLQGYFAEYIQCQRPAR